MKNLIITLVIILVLILVIGGIVIILGTADTTPQRTDTGTEELTTERQLSVSSESREPTSESTEPVTMESTITETTTQPPTTTEEEEATTQPSQDQKQDSGSFASSTGTGMNMKVYWTTFEKSDGSRTVQFDIYLVCRRLFVGARSGALVVDVDGEKVYLNTDSISRDEGPYDDILLGSVTMNLPDDGANCEISWKYNGYYDDKEIVYITASQWID